MDLRKLRYFEAAAIEQNFRRAAKRMHIAHSALSKQIALLEEELGCPLFIRAKQRVQLSEAGQVFLEHVQKILRDVDFAVSQTQLAAQGHRGTLRIGFRETAGRTPCVAKAFAAFNRQYPDVDVQLEQMATISQCDALQNGSLDIGLMYAPPSMYDDFSRLVLAVEHMYVALPQSHRLASKKVLSLKDLKGEPFVSFQLNDQLYYANLFNRIFLKAGVLLNVVREVTTEAALMNLVSVGLGLSVGLGINTDAAPPGVVFKPAVELTETIELQLVWRGDNLTPIAQNFIDIMEATAPWLSEGSDPVRVIVKSGASPLELGKNFVNCFHLDSIFEFSPDNHLRQMFEAA